MAGRRDVSLRAHIALRAAKKPKNSVQPLSSPLWVDEELGLEEALGCIRPQDPALAQGIATSGSC